MKTWTKQAEGRLEEYIEARARRDNLVGSDIRELREDLSAHVYEEAEGLKVERIGSVDVEKIIAGLESRSADQVALLTRKKGWSWALVFGVIMPLLVAIIEILSGFCGGVFFDPVPTVWHSLLVLSVPLVNWWLLTKGRAAGAMAQGIAAGISVVVAIFYGLLFLPLLPLSILAILAMGLGFLSLTPVFAAIAVWLGLRFIWRKAEKPPGISLQLFAITLGLWIAGTVFYSGEEWMGHIGALLILFGTIFGWVLFDRLVSYGWLAKKERAGMPIILRQLCGAIVVLIAASSILKWGYGLELTGLIATSGVAAVILAFKPHLGLFRVDWANFSSFPKGAELLRLPMCSKSFSMKSVPPKFPLWGPWSSSSCSKNSASRSRISTVWAAINSGASRGMATSSIDFGRRNTVSISR